ncbi:MAG: DUF2202 domain-containing protein [Ardenticatenaceae bacterium]|nr:DUF2202 domain-containing protein [Ardenticatenaceae bacterium]
MKTQLNQTKNRLFLILALAGLLLIAAACTTPAATTTETGTTAVTEAIAAEAAAAASGQTETVPEVAAVEPAVGEETTNQLAAVDAPVAVVETVANEPETTARNAVDGLSAANGGSLSDSEIADLLFMREEEKLAHDVYIALYSIWGMNLFQNIAASEQTHTDSVLALLNTYGLTDPVGSNPAGVFVNADLQALYDQLVASGSQSLADALRVGAAIEEIDILDLDKAIAETGQADIVQVYQSLRAGSENHLRAFVSTLERQTGETYQPQYLSLEAYAAIISGTQSQGNGSAGGNGNGGNGRGSSNGNGRGGDS